MHCGVNYYSNTRYSIGSRWVPPTNRRCAYRQKSLGKSTEEEYTEVEHAENRVPTFKLVFHLANFFARTRKSEYDWLVMSSLFVVSQSSFNITAILKNISGQFSSTSHFLRMGFNSIILAWNDRISGPCNWWQEKRRKKREGVCFPRCFQSN